ncbi:MAG: hypothetical protein KC729_00115 [Candidatus Eisenbacteria bacterium]|uniref:Uncharacterized protein n=1 Tax=Eiseniibacteriota bacterium TaxID=2212470 RepID=A0A956LV08_UNCEI|nr:hypothetical protein [Candidatus Eisenbacteria bacterium]
MVPLIAVYQTPPITHAWGLSTRPDTKRVPFVLETRARQLDDEDSFRECRQLHAAAESILSDERRAEFPHLVFRASRHTAVSTPEGFEFISRSEFELVDLEVLR